MIDPYDKIAWHRDSAKERFDYFMQESRKYQDIADSRGCPEDVRKGSLRRAKDAFARAMSIKVQYGI